MLPDLRITFRYLDQLEAGRLGINPPTPGWYVTAYGDDDRYVDYAPLTAGAVLRAAAELDTGLEGTPLHDLTAKAAREASEAEAEFAQRLRKRIAEDQATLDRLEGRQVVGRIKVTQQ